MPTRRVRVNTYIQTRRNMLSCISFLRVTGTHMICAICRVANFQAGTFAFCSNICSLFIPFEHEKKAATLKKTRLSAGYRGYTSSFFVFDLSKMIWNDITGSVFGTSPSARSRHGFVSAGGRLYVHGGVGWEGMASGILSRGD
jgi:hypothetical protein